MSWLGGSLSSFTDQISNLTKDILTEGTEEVGDPSTELKVAQTRIQELEAVLYSQRLENDRVKGFVRELEEKAEGSELQVHAISREYRSLLDEKEKEIKELKQKHHEMLDLHMKSVMSLESAGVDDGVKTMSHSTSTSALSDHTLATTGGDLFAGDEHDFGDNISMQHDINRLRGEVQRLQSECHHWKQKASEVADCSRPATQSDNDEGDTNLHIQIKELEHGLSMERERHQQEVAALQDHHRGKQATLKQKHKQEVTRLNEQLDQLHLQLTQAAVNDNDASAKNVTQLTAHIQELEANNGLLQSQLETDKQKTTDLLSQVQAENNQVKQKNEQLEETMTKLHLEITSLKTERGSLLADITNLQAAVRQQDTQLEGAVEDMTRLRWENEQVRDDLLDAKQTLLDQAYALEVLSDLQHVRHQMDSETVTRKTQLLREKQELVESLISAGKKKGELSATVHSNEELHEQAKEETRSMIEAMGCPRHQQLTKDIVDSLEEENSVLKLRVQELQEQVALLEKTVTTQEKIGGDDKNVIDKMEDSDLGQKKNISHSDTESQWDLSLVQDSRLISSMPDMAGKAGNSPVDQSGELKSLQAKLDLHKGELDILECMKADWQVEKEALEDVLMGLRKQLKEKEVELNNLLSKQSNIDESNDMMGAAEIDRLRNIEEELDDLKTKHADLKQQLENAGHSTAVADVEGLQKELTEESRKVSELTLEKADLEASLVELDGQHSEAIAEVIKIRDSLLHRNEELTEQAGEHEEHLSVLRTELRSQHSQNESFQAQSTQDLSDVSMELEKLRSEHERIVHEKEGYSRDVNVMKVQLATETQTLSELQMDKQELEESVKAKDSKLTEMQIKLQEVIHERKEAERAYRDAMEKLEAAEQSLQALEESSAFETSNQEALENQLQSLQCKLGESMQESNKQKLSLQEVGLELNQSRQEIASLKNDWLESKLKESEGEIVSVRSGLREQQEKDYQVLQTQVEALKSEKEALERELTQNEQKLQNQHKNYEKYIHDIQQSQEMDASTLQDDHNKIMQLCHEKDLKISELEEEMASLKNDMDDSKEMMQSAIDSQQQLSSLVNEKESEIMTLKRENVSLVEKVEEREGNISDLELKVVTFENSQKHLGQLRDENHSLRGEMSLLKRSLDENAGEGDKMESRTLDVITDLESELTMAQDQRRQLETEIGQLAQLIRDHEAGIRELNQKHLEQSKVINDGEDRISKQDDQIAVLQQHVMQKDDELDQTKKRLNRAILLIDPEKQHRVDKKEVGILFPGSSLLALEYPEKGTLDLDEAEVKMREDSNKVPEKVLENSYAEVNGKLSRRSSEDLRDNISVEMDKLQGIIKEKDKVIADLQRSNSSFLKMLESKSLTSNGDRTLVDVHKLENEVRSLKTEREQILAVMNEKSREASKLKSEVHRLMSIISAEKTALDKLAQDNNHLMRKRESSPNDDMQKEVVKNLSRIVRDKDMEIEALTQKNQTLLQVLQDSSQNGSQINTLMLDKDNLAKQLASLQTEREQLVAFVNQKHQESLAYHNEVQRLSAFINSEREKYEKVEQDYTNLVPQFEDRKQALLKAQNELINYRQKYTELEVKHGELVQRTNATETVDLNSYTVKVEEAKRLQGRLTHSQQALQEKESKINSLNRSLSEVELTANSSETEKNNYKKQVEHLSFQLQSVQREVEDIRQESVSVERGKSEQSTELSVLRETNDKLMLSLREREYEVNMLKEKSSTLTALLGEKEGERGQLDRLLRDNESVNQQAQTFQQERDQLMVVLRQRQAQTDDLNKQVQRQKEKEEKLHGELNRLRNHLLQIEEGYTQEALSAEDREKELRNRLARAEEKLLSSSAAVESVNLQAGHQVESLQQQLYVIASQRDAAYLQVSALQEQNQQYAASLANLQLVLEQFQQDRESTLASETERYQTQIIALQQEIAGLQSYLHETQTKLEEASDGLEAAARLSEQLDKKEAVIEALREEVQLREKALKTTEEGMKKLATKSESKVDKLLVKNLIVGYLSTPQNKRNEALRVVSVVLNFSQEDFHRISGDARGSWIPGFLRFGKGSPTTPPVTPTRQHSGFRGLDKSFSELFVTFLEKESSPPPQAITLPAEQMAQETRQKQKEKEKDHPKPPQFNPFTAPRHAVMPIQIGGRSSPHDSHLLSSSLSPALPVFTALSTPEAGISITPTGSGRSTPSNPTSSSAILKDVLGRR